MESKASREIVCATDFSVSATEAATVAAAIVARADAKLILTHVADETNTHSQSEQEQETYLHPIRKALQREAERLSQDGAVVETKVFTGRWAEDAIVEYVTKQPPEMIILAGERKSAIARWTLGNVSEAIAQQAPVPTLVVRSALALAAWAHGKQPLTVMAGTDLSSESEAVLEWIRSLPAIGECRVILGHAYVPEPVRARYGLSRFATLEELPLDLHNTLERNLMDKGRAILGEDIQLQAQVAPGGAQADTSLIDLARHVRADLLVVGSHQRRGIHRLVQGSVSRNVLRSAPMSVACVPLRRGRAGETGSQPLSRHRH